MMGELCEMGLHTGSVEIRPDGVLALEWYRKALKNGNDRAMFNIGAMYEKGDVIPRDMAKAIRLYTEADKKGNRDATKRLTELQELEIKF